MAVSKDKKPEKTVIRPGEPLPFAIQNWNVVDIEEFERLATLNMSRRKIGAALSVSRGTATTLIDGNHWQQSPKRVRQYNDKMGTKIDPKTGIAPVTVLEKYSAKAKQEVKAIEARVREVELIKSGAPAKPFANVTLDTKYFLEQIEEKLAMTLESLTESEIKKSSVRERVTAISAFVEKRALLRGEPTQIVTHEQRQKLDDLLPELIKEAKRRGITIEGKMKDVTPKPELIDG